MKDFLLNILSLLFGGAVAWLFTCKKQEAETMRENLEGINLAVKIWKDTAAELAKKVDVLTQQCEQLTADVEMLRRENKTLKAKLDKAIQTIQTFENKQ